MSACPDSDLELPVRRALALLSRASSEWRSTAGENGPLHWPTAIALATRELRDALETLESEPDRRELLAEAAQRLRGWSAGAAQDGKRIERIEKALEAAHHGNGAAARPPVNEPLCAHCGGTGFEGDDPCAFCNASGRDARAEDARAGMAWFNALAPAERSYWLMVSESARPADAWRAFQTWEGR